MEGQLYHHHHHHHHHQHQYENSFGVASAKQQHSNNHHPFGVGVKKFNSFNGVLDMDHVLEKACLILENLVRANSELIQSNSSTSSKQLTRFHSRTIPDISIRKYLLRIIKYSPHPAECIVTGLVYLDKVIRKHALVVTMYNVHRLLIIAFVLSVKYHCDQIYTNKHYAKVGGVQAKELAKLEFDFLRMLNYDIIVSKRELDHYTEKLFNIGKSAPKEVHETQNLHQNDMDGFRGRTGSDVTMESVRMAHQKSSRSYSISAVPQWQKKEITGEEVP